MNLTLTALSFFLSTSVSVLAQNPMPDPNGIFTGNLKLQPTGDGVHMAVLETYSYTDPLKHRLTANPGFTTDGASIPRALWTIVGSPFTGKYIGAAVIHDVGCDTHKYSWEVTHRMFYTAMLDLGVDEDYAKLLYWGVRLGGPRWVEIPCLNPNVCGGKETTIPLGSRLTLSNQQANEIYSYIKSRSQTKAGAVSLDEIDAMTPLNDPLPEGAIPR